MFSLRADRNTAISFIYIRITNYRRFHFLNQVNPIQPAVPVSIASLSLALVDHDCDILHLGSLCLIESKPLGNSQTPQQLFHVETQ